MKTSSYQIVNLVLSQIVVSVIVIGALPYILSECEFFLAQMEKA